MELNMKITDLHSHVVFGVDDGSDSLAMSLEMIGRLRNQGVRQIFCTSHNGYCQEDVQRYLANFQMLKICSATRYPDVSLYSGCELLCSDLYIDDILYGLESGVFLPLADSKYVLTELYHDVTPKEAITVTEKLREAGWKPVLAHMERYPGLHSNNAVNELIQRGCLIQVNAISFAEDSHEETKVIARSLLKNQLIHFIGSDCHKNYHRPPALSKGVEYIFTHSNKEYAKKIVYENVRLLILNQS